MKVVLNGKEIEIDACRSLKDILASENLSIANVAVAVNNKLVLRADWEKTFLAENDKIVVIAAAYGG